jgi:hypothetical protein
MRKTLITWLLLALCLIPAHATSIVALVQPDRILLAADSRSGSDGPSEGTDDKFCKIVVMNDGAFALNGISSTSHKDDNSIAWEGFALGKEMYAKHHQDILGAANEWADRTVTFWTPFFSHQVEDGERILRDSGVDIVDYDVAGFFRNPDRPRVVIGSVQIDRMVGPPRKPQKVVHIFGPQTEPYSSNPITMELIAGQTERAKTTLTAWLQKLNTIKESDRNMRTLEYLIQQTANYDHHVNRTVNILEIEANKKPHWLQNITCK